MSQEAPIRTWSLSAPAEQTRLLAPAGFRAAGVYVQGVPEGEPVHLRVRASADGQAWTDWIEAHGAGGLAYFGGLHRVLEYEIEPGSPAVIGIRFLLIDPGLTPPKTLEGIRDVRRRAAEAPVVVSRPQWGCTPEACPPRAPPAFTTVTHLVVHHTAGANMASDWPAVVRSIWALHVNGNGWSDIGYNYLIDPNGVLYEGRAGGEGVIGAHFSGVNSGTMGVSLLGTFSTLTPADQAVVTLREMLTWQADKWKLDPGAQAMHASSGLPLNVVSGHRDAGLSPRATSRTECPGNGLYTLLPDLRLQTRARLDLTGPLPRATCQAGRPCIAADGVRTAAGADPRPVVPGSLISIYGANLAGEVTSAAELPLPSSLGGVSATVSGQPIPLLFVSPSQINALLPASVNTGTARMVVTANDVAGADTYFWVTEAVPSIFTYGNNRALAVNHEDGSVNSAAAPVRSGGALIVYLTGGGAARLPWSATIGGRAAGLLYLGPAPGFPGLYQANLVAAADAAPGDQPLVITVSGAASRSAMVSVAPR